METDEKPGELTGERYRQVLETAPDAMIVVDRDGSIVFANAQTETLFGYAREDLLGKSLTILIPERFHGSHSGHVGRYFAHPGTRPMGSGLDLFGRRANGTEIAIEVSLSPVGTDAGMLVSAAIRDITERKRIEAAAEAGSAAKSEFLSSMSHELRTPLNAILGFAQLLQRDKKEPLSDRHRERVSQILKGGEHLLRLIDDILDLSRIEAGRVSISTEPVKVADVLEEIRATLTPIAALQGILVDVDAIPFDLPMISADRTRFVQILMNFGSNAIKYNRPSGQVSFTVSLPAVDRLRVSVKDTGMGIPSDKQDKLFQPFQRAGQETGPIEGTGIGLVITKRLAGLMNGDVGFESTAGQGSTFWVDIPVHTSSAGSVAPTALRQGSDGRFAAEGNRRVLYVEDNPANVVFMKDLLGSFENIELLTAPTAEVGIELARKHLPDVVIMDINLPGMSGVEALRVLRATASTSRIPVIALTAAASERDKARGTQAGFYRYLTKPVRVDELLTALEALLAQ
ncbi:PAS family protein [Labilithrix luteola]|uniref:histidine kinase n=1 Tax=Labilithrix luteola TaxID=1391654 RepID=A0A0K1Q442_9BACT|nr:PAS domain-containing hybrid sensor histidine kinase/response regulator [Labilithrix luteola]AKV00518.1 PAS family protein [Labilithrix luteola]